MTELKKLLDRYTLEEIAAALLEDAECPYTLTKLLADACSAIVVRRLGEIAKEMCTEIMDEAERSEHLLCPVVIFAVLTLGGEAMPVKEMKKLRDKTIEHVREESDY